MNQPQNIDVQAIFTEIVEQRNQALNSAAEARAYVRMLEAQLSKLTLENESIRKQTAQIQTPAPPTGFDTLADNSKPS